MRALSVVQATAAEPEPNVVRLRQMQAWNPEVETETQWLNRTLDLIPRPNLCKALDLPVSATDGQIARARLALVGSFVRLERNREYYEAIEQATGMDLDDAETLEVLGEVRRVVDPDLWTGITIVLAAKSFFGAKDFAEAFEQLKKRMAPPQGARAT